MLRLCWMVAALSVGLGVRLAVAAPPTEARVAVTGGNGCPGAAALAAALGGALPGTRVRVAGEPSRGGPLVELIDLGSGYRVRAAGLERTFRDPGRRCPERARAAAVFAALALDPIGFGEARAARRPRQGASTSASASATSGVTRRANEVVAPAPAPARPRWGSQSSCR